MEDGPTTTNHRLVCGVQDMGSSSKYRCNEGLNGVGSQSNLHNAFKEPNYDFGPDRGQ